VKRWSDLPIPLLPVSLLVTSAADRMSTYDYFVGITVSLVAVVLWWILRE